jgi:hypothetical protein
MCEVNEAEDHMRLDREGDVDHPILDRPWEWEIAEFRYVRDPATEASSFIELTFRRSGLLRRLRFQDPRDLRIEPGFPQPTGGMRILDVRSRQWDGIGVEVADFEASFGAITFRARDVIALE